MSRINNVLDAEFIAGEIRVEGGIGELARISGIPRSVMSGILGRLSVSQPAAVQITESGWRIFPDALVLPVREPVKEVPYNFDRVSRQWDRISPHWDSLRERMASAGITQFTGYARSLFKACGGGSFTSEKKFLTALRRLAESGFLKNLEVNGFVYTIKL